MHSWGGGPAADEVQTVECVDMAYVLWECPTAVQCLARNERAALLGVVASSQRQSGRLC